MKISAAVCIMSVMIALHSSNGLTHYSYTSRSRAKEPSPSPTNGESGSTSPTTGRSEDVDRSTFMPSIVEIPSREPSSSPTDNECASTIKDHPVLCHCNVHNQCTQSSLDRDDEELRICLWPMLSTTESISVDDLGLANDGGNFISLVKSGVEQYGVEVDVGCNGSPASGLLCVARVLDFARYSSPVVYVHVNTTMVANNGCEYISIGSEIFVDTQDSLPSVPSVAPSIASTPGSSPFPTEGHSASPTAEFSMPPMVMTLDSPSSAPTLSPSMPPSPDDNSATGAFSEFSREGEESSIAQTVAATGIMILFIVVAGIAIKHQPPAAGFSGNGPGVDVPEIV